MKKEVRNNKNLKEYVDQMPELKDRIAHLKKYENRKKDRFIIENAALHIRKIIELFAYSVMSLQKDSYKEYRNKAGVDFMKDWNGRDILANLMKLNPDMFFKPIKKEVHINPDGVKNLQPYVAKECYNIKQLNKLYDRCGGILHVSNPWKSSNKIESFHGELPSIIKKLINTFEDHTILFNHHDSSESTVVLITLTGQGGVPSMHLVVSHGNFKI